MTLRARSITRAFFSKLTGSFSAGRGEANFQMKRLDDAREDLAKALALAPEDEQVKRLYARAKKAAGAELQPTQAVC